MDTLTASTTLATVVGLICNYKQERGAKKELAHRDFIEWLEYHRHEDIKNLIANTHGLQEEVNQLLREDHAEILKKLDSINEVLSQVLSRVSGFEVFAQKLGSGAELSEQALSILHQFADSKLKQFVYLTDRDELLLLPPPNLIIIEDVRFLHDDLHTLEMLDFIRVSDHSGNGDPIYSLTRSGVHYAAVTRGRASN